ncbi:MAG: helicase, partial [Novosphingobium sp.]|nr:helicase [Novosphingobium sp.]
AIGMGLNLDVTHVAFAGLSKFDGVRQRRLTPSEMAQIAGRAGRHQRDGTFGTLTGSGRHDAEFTDEEVYSIEEHRFAPISKLFWRDAEPRFDSIDTLIADLEAPPDSPGLVPAPEAIDLAVLKRLAEDPAIADTVRSPATVARFWEACRLPDFRQHGSETHARFVARLWQDLRHGTLGSDYVAQAIAQLDNVAGDIDTLQGRIAAIRSWSYIAQRPDWVLAKDEMAERARAVEARLSDALHARLTERFVNRRTAVLMKKLGPDAALLPVKLDGEDIFVDGEHIGELKGFRFHVDPDTRHDDRKLLLAAAERHVPALLGDRATALAKAIAAGEAALELHKGTIRRDGQQLASLVEGRSALEPQIEPDRTVAALDDAPRKVLMASLEGWLARWLAPLEPLARIDAASSDEQAGPELRALLIRLAESGGMMERAGSGLDALDKAQRAQLTKLGVRVGALDIFVPQMLRPEPLTLWRELAAIGKGRGMGKPEPAMPPALAATRKNRPPGYRKVGQQYLRVDMAEKLLRDAHTLRVAAGKRPFSIDPAMAISMGLTKASFAHLLRLAGFQPRGPRQLPEGAHGPPAPATWRWRPPRRVVEECKAPVARPGSAFAALAELVR